MASTPLTDEIDRLKAENQELRQRISQLEAELHRQKFLTPEVPIVNIHHERYLP
jgi:hypothetical protein